MSYSNPMHHSEGARAPYGFTRESQEISRLRWALSHILDVAPDENAGKHDLWMSLGEIRRIARHGLTRDQS